MFGTDNPVSYPTYTHKVAYRGLIPMEKAVEAIGEYKAKNQHMHIGPKAHMLHFPVANQTLMNVVAFAPDPEAWADSKTFVAPATRQDLARVRTRSTTDDSLPDYTTATSESQTLSAQNAWPDPIFKHPQSSYVFWRRMLRLLAVCFIISLGLGMPYIFFVRLPTIPFECHANA